MQIVPGKTAPAELVTDNGVLITQGTYTHCGQTMDVLQQEFATTGGAEQISRLQREVAVLEQLRPTWAQGYTDDSQAAQASTAALSEVWKLLGVDNQTDCMRMLRELVEHRMTDTEDDSVSVKLCAPEPGTIPMNVYYKPEKDNFYDNHGNGLGDEFYKAWRKYKDDFPVWENGIRGIMDRHAAFKRHALNNPVPEDFSDDT